jgi:hypothetical protein
MAAIARDALRRQFVQASPTPWRADTTQTFVQGTFVKKVSVGGDIKIQPATLNTDGPSCVGVMAQSDPKVSQPFGSEVQRLTRLPVLGTGVFRMFLKAGEAYEPGDKLVIDETNADHPGQAVRLQGGDAFDNVIGEIAPDQEPIAAAAAGDEGDVWLAPPGLGRNSGAALTLL